MAEGATEWAPIYVIGSGFKKLNGAYKGAGDNDGCLRYKHPDQLIWCFYSGDKNLWMFSNKSRFLEDGKVMYKNKNNCEPGASVPQKGWKKGSPPGTVPVPKVINSAFVEKEEVHVYSKKAKKWMQGTVRKVNESGSYKCSIKGVKKPLNIPRAQLREFPEDSRFSVKQFVEIRSKSGDWLEAMVGEVKGDGKYYCILPDGKGATLPEDRLRASELCRDAINDAPAATVKAADGGSDEKDKRIAELEAIIADQQKVIDALKEENTKLTERIAELDG